jgi:hypothetical protein
MPDPKRWKFLFAGTYVGIFFYALRPFRIFSRIYVPFTRRTPISPFGLRSAVTTGHVDRKSADSNNR